jgi:hypothetical protein
MFPLPVVCEVTPFITTIRVQYSGTIVNISDVVDKRPLNTDGSNWPLLILPAHGIGIGILFFPGRGQ